MNSKLEKVFIVLIWYAELFVITRIFPPPENIVFKQHALYFLASIVITSILFNIYVRVRNRVIYKKINNYRDLNEYDLCICYIDKQIKKHKKVIWIKLERIITLAIKGDIAEFRSSNVSIEGNENNAARLDVVFKFKALFNYLSDEDYENNFAYKDCDLDNCLFMLLNKDNMSSDELSSKALLLYNSQIPLYKSIAAMILSNYYLVSGDVENAELFAKETEKHAPSAEVKRCLLKELSLEQNASDAKGDSSAN